MAGVVYLIYGLRRKGTTEVRYVGKTTKGSERFSAHIDKSRWGITSAKYDWMRHHGSDNIESVVLEVCPAGDESYLNYAEKYWILSLKEFGCNLLNHTKGGDGGATRTGMKTPEATKAKQREALLKRRHNEESKTKLSDYQKSKAYRVCCLLCRGEFSTGLNLTRHIQQSHDEGVLRNRKLRRLEKNLASNEDRLSKFYSKFPDSSSGSCVECRLSFGYPGLRKHMSNNHGVTLPSSDKKKSRRIRLDNTMAVG